MKFLPGKSTLTLSVSLPTFIVSAFTSPVISMYLSGAVIFTLPAFAPVTFTSPDEAIWVVAFVGVSILVIVPPVILILPGVPTLSSIGTYPSIIAITFSSTVVSPVPFKPPR